MSISRRWFLIAISSLLTLRGLRTLFSNRQYSAVASTLPAKHKDPSINGLKPRVVHVSSSLSNWNFEDLNYFDSIDQEKVNDSLDSAVISLTSSNSARQAWEHIFKTYKKGDKVALRVNLNPADKNKETFFNDIVVSPQIINYVVKSLNTYLHIPFDNIILYELTRPIPEYYRDYISYPIQYVSKPGTSLVDKVKNKLRLGLAAPDFNYPIEMRETVVDDNGNTLTCYLPKVVTQTDHLINLSVFKYHQFGLLSGLLKNHYGSVRFSNLSYYPVYLHGEKVFKSSVDLNRNKHLRGKTRLHVIDSIFGAYQYEPLAKVKKRWMTFGDDGLPNSLFIGTDPVAIESVLYSYLFNERNHQKLNTYFPNHLKDAADKGIGQFEYNLDGSYDKIEYIKRNV